MSKRMLIVIGIVVVVAVLYAVQNNKKVNATAGSGAGGCQVQVTADVLNVRTGPAQTDKVVKKLTTGAIVAATSKKQNDYRELAANQWADNQFLKPVSGPC